VRRISLSRDYQRIIQIFIEAE